jgi:hypothetical protein
MDFSISAVYAAFSRADQERGYTTGALAPSFWGGETVLGWTRWCKFNPNTAARIIPAGAKNVFFKNALIL